MQGSPDYRIHSYAPEPKNATDRASVHAQANAFKHCFFHSHARVEWVRLGETRENKNPTCTALKNWQLLKSHLRFP